MDHHRQSIRTGAAVLLLAVVIRLAGGGFFQPNPAVLSFFLYLQTGRTVQAPTVPTVPTATAPLPTVPALAPDLPAFSAEDLDLVELRYSCDYRPELAPLLVSPLRWDLTGDSPKVLILHTHATESYTQVPGETYQEAHGPYRTLDENYNMISVGKEVARVLEAGGISVIHDTTLHDYPDYNQSYNNARKTIQAWLEEYPDICLVLDIHRDAAGEGTDQLVTAGTVGGQASSQLMLVTGTDFTGNYFPDWEQNLALALKLTALLEQQDPGLTRPVTLREHRFNMDLTPGSVIVEVGAAGDTHSQAMLAANALARAVLLLAKGSK